jgi:hypothetical protein
MNARASLPRTHSHTVQLTPPLIAGFEFDSERGITSRRGPTRSPDTEKRLGDEQAGVPPGTRHPNERDRALADRLHDRVVRPTRPFAHFFDGEHGLAVDNIRHRKLPTAPPAVDLAQGNDVECLFALDPQVWHQTFAARAGHGRMQVPDMQRTTVRRRRLADVSETPEGLMSERDRFRSDLFQGHPGLIVRRPIPHHASAHADAPVRVDHAGQVSQCVRRNRNVHTMECNK